VKGSRHCPIVFTGEENPALVDYHADEEYMPEQYQQRRDTAMAIMKRRADNFTNRNCPKLKGKDKLLPKALRSYHPSSRSSSIKN
jgi:hypothetical protein